MVLFSRVGLTCIPRKFTSDSAARSTDYNQYRSSIIKHLRLKGIKDNLDHYVALSHWHPKILEAHDKSKVKGTNKMFPRAISFELGKTIGLTANYKIQGNECSPLLYYINVPSATFDSFNNYLSTEFVDQQIVLIASGEQPVSKEIRLSLSTSASEKITGDAASLARLTSVQQRSAFMEAELLHEERALVEKKKQDKKARIDEEYISTVADMSEGARKILRKTENQVTSLKRQLEEESEKNNLLRDKNIKVTNEIKGINNMVSRSIVRANIVCPIWHENNPEFVHYWLGFKDYAEFVTYHKCLWPDVDTIVHIKDGHITEFEKSIITKIVFRKGLEFKLLGFIWDRTNIGRYVKSWAPLWGEAGADLSILDINEDILRALTPEDFVNGCTDKVCGLVDGKDFKTETVRIQSGITRAGHSNKVNCSALRVLSWIINNGLNVERSEPYFGRASETHIVGVLGSHIGEVPIRKADKALYTEMKKFDHAREIRVRHTVSEAGLMVAGVTLLKGDSMEGDEELQPEGDIDAHFCDRVDDWFDKIFDAHEKGNVSARKKAKIFTTEDHDICEKAVLRSGPNKSPESKLIQLRRLRRLHIEYESNNLSSCLLSEYLDVTKTLRKDMINVLRGRPLKGSNGSVLSDLEHNCRLKELRLPLRLGKFPQGWSILADRGFANDATRYPNMNVQMTPSFLSGRDQFTYSELSADMVKCKLRYISETNFARVTDENLLTDVIPTRVLPFVKDCISWGHANANLCQKYKDREYV